MTLLRASKFCPHFITPAPLDDILVKASRTSGAAAVRFIKARKDGCAERCDMPFVRRGFFISDSFFSRKFMKNNYEACKLENDTVCLHSYYVVDYLKCVIVVFDSFINKNIVIFCSNITILIDRKLSIKY